MLLLSGFLHGREVCVFQSDFAMEPELSGWEVMRSGVHPSEQGHHRAYEGKEVFLKTGEGAFGLSHQFDRPLGVSENTAAITLEVEFRPFSETAQNNLEVALTSRLRPEGNKGGPFMRGLDTGFVFQGSVRENAHAANYIGWRKEGAETRLHKPLPPYSLIPRAKLRKWTTLKLEYDNMKKTLSARIDAEPPLVMHAVDLNGMVLKNVFLGARGNEYRNVKVISETK